MASSRETRGKPNERRPGASTFVRGGEQTNREIIPHSSISTVRRVDPDNPAMANCQFNMARDFTSQAAVVPPGAARGANKGAPVPMNASGKPAHALPNIVVGAGQDDKGIF